MKKYRKTLHICASLFLLGSLMSCESVFESRSSSMMGDDGASIDSPDNSIYSVMGILSQVQQLGERSLLLGELRGDLMEATSAADADLQEISSFEVSEDNVYLLRRDYYNVINNCNLAIERMDTSVVYYQDRVLLPEYVAIRAYRAWTYWQMALAFGQVRWIDKPLLSFDEAIAEYPLKDYNEVAQLLIDELTPFVDVPLPDYGMVDSYASSVLFVPLAAFLGDLHLYLGHYEQAAKMYYKQIEKSQVFVSSEYSSHWKRETRPSADNLFEYPKAYVGEMLSGFVYSSLSRDYHPSLIRLAYNERPSLRPAQTFVESMNRAMHFYAESGALTISAYLEGDLRGQAISSSGQVIPAAYGTSLLGQLESNRICKWNEAAVVDENGFDPANEAVDGLMFTRVIPLYRTPQLYLRMAEALNRMGHPSVAFAVVKYGLNNETMSDSTKVNKADVAALPWLDFSWQNNNNGNKSIGTATRGRGRGVPLDKLNFVIPDFSTDATDAQTALADSILFVEDCIVDELAAETCFEGARFFDLLRVAQHRGEFPAYMAAKVSQRFDDAAAMMILLSDEDKWFLN
ncbi:MAG: RagB/SusD family nutrient uptake outer membrane protein [Bacteroidales bacterium]|nr:RagB/SusD family nutrient uptake outer membrane protein [Bacteroidales bacterium]